MQTWLPFISTISLTSERGYSWVYMKSCLLSKSCPFVWIGQHSSIYSFPGLCLLAVRLPWMEHSNSCGVHIFGGNSYRWGPLSTLAQNTHIWVIIIHIINCVCPDLLCTILIIWLVLQGHVSSPVIIQPSTRALDIGWMGSVKLCTWDQKAQQCVITELGSLHVVHQSATSWRKDWKSLFPLLQQLDGAHIDFSRIAFVIQRSSRVVGPKRIPEWRWGFFFFFFFFFAVSGKQLLYFNELHGHT